MSIYVKIVTLKYVKNNHNLLKIMQFCFNKLTENLNSKNNYSNFGNYSHNFLIIRRNIKP